MGASSGKAGGAEAISEAPPTGGGVWVFLLRVLGAVSIPIAAFLLLWLTFEFLRDSDANRFVVVGVATRWVWAASSSCTGR